MKIEIFTKSGDVRTDIVTYTVKGIDKVANDSAHKEGYGVPKVTLSFELTRSGLL
jgi:hypothetical protein